MIFVHFQGKPFNIMVFQVYTPTSNGEEAEVEWFSEDLQELLELTPPKYVLFIIAKIGSQGISGVTGKIGLGVQNEAGQRTTSNDFKYNSLLFIPNGISKGREMGGMPRN